MALRFNTQVNQADLKNLNGKLKQLSEFSKKESRLSLDHAARNTVGRMKQNAPVDTGRLRREVDYELVGDGVTIHSEAIDPDTGIDYAPIQEYGGPRNNPPAQPYFRPNIIKFISELIKDLNRKLKLIAEN